MPKKENSVNEEMFFLFIFMINQNDCCSSFFLFCLFYHLYGFGKQHQFIDKVTNNTNFIHKHTDKLLVIFLCEFFVENFQSIFAYDLINVDAHIPYVCSNRTFFHKHIEEKKMFFFKNE